MGEVSARLADQAALVASGAVPTIGVEEEFLLVDAGTGWPMPVGGQVLDGASRRPALGTDEVTHELLQVQVEVATPVCSELDEAGGHLLRMRHEVGEVAEQHGARLMAIGAAPWMSNGAPVEESRRYQEMFEQAPGLVDEQFINGMHVHVAVPSRAVGLEVANRLRPDLPVLVAMGANSPLWRGRDTGFASWRALHFDRWPVGGTPPVFEGEADYEARVRALLDSGVIFDRAQLYWEARVSDSFPTLEIRTCDVQLRVDDAVMLAGLIRALVMTAMDDVARERPRPDFPVEIVRAAKWQASRHGLDGDLYDLRAGRRVRAGDLVAGLLDRTDAALHRSGDAGQVHKLVNRLLREGTGASRQRAQVASRGLRTLVGYVAAETAATPG